MKLGIVIPTWLGMALVVASVALASWQSVTSHLSSVRLDICTYALADERALRTEAGYLALFFSGYVAGNIRPVDAVALHTATQRLLNILELHPNVENKLSTMGKADVAETMITSGLLEAEIDHD